MHIFEQTCQRCKVPQKEGVHRLMLLKAGPNEGCVPFAFCVNCAHEVFLTMRVEREDLERNEIVGDILIQMTPP